MSRYISLLRKAKSDAASRMSVELAEVAKVVGVGNANSLTTLVSSGRIAIEKAKALAQAAGWGEAQIEDLVWEGVIHKLGSRKEGRAIAQVMLELVDAMPAAKKVDTRRRLVAAVFVGGGVD